MFNKNIINKLLQLFKMTDLCLKLFINQYIHLNYMKKKKKPNFWPLDGSYHLTTYLNLREIVAKTIKKTT